jgi:peptidyl-prolyl cis-trans isomerase A (cyclophilin A)
MRLPRWTACAALIFVLTAPDLPRVQADDPNQAEAAREIRRRIRATKPTPPAANPVAPATPTPAPQPATNPPQAPHGQPAHVATPVQPPPMAAGQPAGAPVSNGLPRVALEIGTPGEVWGTVVLELEQNKTPLTVRNFLQYVDSGFYSGVIFHRVVPGFIAQAGGYTSITEKKLDGLRAPVRNESKSGLSNTRGTIAMARNRLPQTANSQFFFNLKDNPGCDWDYAEGDGWGYCAFGRVVSGLEVIERIAALPRGPQPALPTERSAPANPPQIRRAYRMPSEAAASGAAAQPAPTPRTSRRNIRPPQPTPGQPMPPGQPTPPVGVQPPPLPQPEMPPDQQPPPEGEPPAEPQPIPPPVPEQPMPEQPVEDPPPDIEHEAEKGHEAPPAQPPPSPPPAPQYVNPQWSPR